MKIVSKYTLKRTKLHHLKKIAGAYPRTLGKFTILRGK